MTESSSELTQNGAVKSSRGNEVLIAIIAAVSGLAGVLVTAAFANWDKVFPPDDVVTAKFSGYRPTGDPQIELRYFTEITGQRDILKKMQAAILDHFHKQAESEADRDPETRAKIFKIIEEELAAQYDALMNAYVPIATKYLSLKEIQELNKFFSTPVMRELVRKLPLINREFFPVGMVLLRKSRGEIARRIEELLKTQQLKGRSRGATPSK